MAKEEATVNGADDAMHVDVGVFQAQQGNGCGDHRDDANVVSSVSEFALSLM